MTLDQIRKDLKDIRYYYGRKHIFDTAVVDMRLNQLMAMVKRYNQAIQNAPARLCDMYICLYTKGYTQERLAEELCVSPQYVQIQHKRMLVFLKNYFESPLGEADL